MQKKTQYDLALNKYMMNIYHLCIFALIVGSSKCRVINLMNYTTPPLPVQEKLNQYSPTEERLLRYLFKDYNPHIMPRENLNESFKLYIGMAMSQLINIVF